MTRETKIGLLVGLAFIIIVGILLSEPLSHSGEVQPAPLPGIAQNVRNGVTTPGAGAASPPVSIQPQNATPQQPVPTHEEVNRPPGVVVIGPGGSGSGPQTSTLAGNRPTGPSTTLVGPRSGTATADKPSHPDNPAPPENNVSNPGGSDHADPRVRVANANGEELVPFGPTPSTPRAAKPGLSNGAKSYVAVSGDSLSKIAAKFYGSNTKAMRDAIVNANASLKQNPDRIIIGQSYTIPAIDPSAAQPAPQPPTARTANSTDSVAATEYWYTVKENDNLWRIAKEQLGDAGAVAVLKELNKDVLKGGDIVHINMKLRLPNKPVTAS